MAPLTLGVFGAFQVTLTNGSNAKFESDKARALLAYLAVESDRPHRRDALIGLLWPDEPEQIARQNFRQALYSLPQTIRDSSARPPYLLITRDEIQFNPASKFSLDVASFHSHLAATANHSHSRLDMCAVCAPRLQQAIDLYRGKFLQEFFLEDSDEFEEWAVAQRESLHQRALDALTNLGNYYELNGDLGAARRCAMRALELDPWREQAHRQMMRVFALEGQTGAALTQYETCRRVLADEMGVEPSSETRELFEKIKSGSWKAEVGNRKMELGNQVPNSNFSLPTHLTLFIGRERELQDLGRLIGDPGCRWITLVGPGGIGKTRLAVEAASNQRDKFAHGVVFVPLVGVESVDAIIPAIAQAIGFSFYGPTNPRIQLFNYLRDKQMLLVLDNVEQLVNAADLFVELLERTTAIKLFATSRESLNVQGEWVFPVEGLPIPVDDGIQAMEASAAVALFVQRAQRTRAGFTLSAEDRPSVARLCGLVEGTPLALELAATWVRTLSVKEIVDEIEHNLDFLSATVRDLSVRHRSLRVVFDHSWELLAEEEQKILLRLAVFRGGFRREAAEQVAGATLSTLSSLIAKSLVRRSSENRYDLHELVRQFAVSKLGADEQARTNAQHSRYYLDWLGQCANRLRDHRQVETVAELTADVDNLRVAWDWAVAHLDVVRVCQVSHALWYWLELRSWLTEGEMIFRNAAEIFQARQTEINADGVVLFPTQAMQVYVAFFNLRLGKVPAALATLVQCAVSLQATPDHLARIETQAFLGMAFWWSRKLTEARESLQAGLELARACGEHWYETIIGEYLGSVIHDIGEQDLARRHLTEALTRARAIGDPMITIQALSFLGLLTLASGEMDQSEKFWRECLALAQEIRYRSGIGRALDGLGLVTRATDPKQADTWFVASIEMFRKAGDRTLALVLCHQGYNALVLGEKAKAKNVFVEALRFARQGGDVPFALEALLGLTVIEAKNSNDEHALEFATYVAQHPAAAHDVKARAENLCVEIKSRLTPQQIDAVQARARATNLDQAVHQVLGTNSATNPSH